MLPTKEAAAALLREHVTDDYHLHHALMVAVAMEGYAQRFAASDASGSDAATSGLNHPQVLDPSLGESSPVHRPAQNEDPLLWYVTGLLHDIDFQEHPDTHPGPSLHWFKEWGFPDSLIHAVEAHAYGYHGFATLPQTKLAAALVACDELTGIFYAYRKMNPLRYGDMKASSIRKKFKDPGFAAKIDSAAKTHMR